jgi:large subunit ribosomal protein L7/L12
MADEEKKSEEVVIPEKFASLVQELEKLSVLDMAELVKILEKKFGVSAAAPVMVAGGAGADTTKAEEKTAFDLELTTPGSNRIGVIRVVREVTDKGLKDAKDLVDGAPKVLLEGVPKEKAEEVKKKLEEAGATATIK